MISARFTIALSSLCWAVILFLPGRTFDLPAYHLMKQLGDEHTWATLFFIHAISTITSICTENRTRLMFVADAFFGAALWTTTVVTCLISLSAAWPHSPHAIIAPSISIMMACWWWLIRWIVQCQQNGGDCHGE